MSWTGALDPTLEVFNFGQGFPGDGEFHQIIGTQKNHKWMEKTRKTLPIRYDFCQLQDDPALTIYFNFRHIASILTEHRGFNWMGNSVFFQKPPSVTLLKSLRQQRDDQLSSSR